jgi:CDP-6-deoxy-D-xylo-4-hexulose-3-dehydrase
MGAKFNNQFAGTFGLMGSFSSFFSHHISTMEGGMILTNDDELFHILLTLRAHGWTRNLPIKNLVTGEKEDDEFKESFKFVLPGYNVRPLEMSGAIGLEQLKKLPNFLKQRIKNAELFTSLFSDHPFIRIQKSIDESSWFGFSLILKEGFPKAREEVINILNKNQIDTRPIVTGNFVNNEVLDYFDYEVHGEMINANYLDRNGFFVGNHQKDLTTEIKYLYKVLSYL